MTRVTIRDVAKEAGVSIATVSKALNGVNVVKPGTKKKVEAAAQKLHYTPNLMGKQLKSGRTKMIGFFTHTIAGPYFSSLIEAVVQEAEKYDYGVNVIISADRQVLTSNILGNVVDGFIGFEQLINENDLDAIRKEKLKAVFIDRKIHDESVSSMVFNSFESGKIATEHLLSLGHKKIAFLVGYEGIYDSDERYAGYRSALKAAQIEMAPEWKLTGYFEEQASYDATKNFIQKYENTALLPTAFIAGNDLSALGTVKAIQDIGYYVPQDFSVVGFDDIELLKYFKPSITTVRNPIIEQGRASVRHLMALIEEEEVGKDYVLDCELVVRETTRRIR